MMGAGLSLLALASSRVPHRDWGESLTTLAWHATNMLGCESPRNLLGAGLSQYSEVFNGLPACELTLGHRHCPIVALSLTAGQSRYGACTACQHLPGWGCTAHPAQQVTAAWQWVP